MQGYVRSSAVLQHLRQIKPAGCLFDLDGLLLDTEPLHSRAWAASIEHFGAHVPEGLLLELRGRNRFDNAAAVIKKLLPQCGGHKSPL